MVSYFNIKILWGGVANIDRFKPALAPVGNTGTEYGQRHYLTKAFKM